MTKITNSSLMRTHQSPELTMLPIVAGMCCLGFISMDCGCSDKRPGGNTKGSLVSRGQPLGDFTITPVTCQSGGRLNFFGVILQGRQPTDGRVVVGRDEKEGDFVRVTKPGSCKPPDDSPCPERVVSPEHCSTFKVDTRKKPGNGDAHRPVDGRLRLECTFPEGGRVQADLQFENCN